MSITEVIQACAGFLDHNKCARKDNSHGYWGSCAGYGSEFATSGGDCSYFSNMYFRETGAIVSAPPVESNATFRKVVVVSVNSTSVGVLNISTNVSVLLDRFRRSQLLNSSVSMATAGGSGLVPPGVLSANGNNCGQIVVYSTNVLKESSGKDLMLFNEEQNNTANVVCRSACVTSGSQIEMSCDTLAWVAQSPSMSGSRRLLRRRLSTTLSYVVSFESVGTGKDLVDFGVNISGGSIAPPILDSGNSSGTKSTFFLHLLIYKYNR
jgi:hypothetical protein